MLVVLSAVVLLVVFDGFAVELVMFVEFEPAVLFGSVAFVVFELVVLLVIFAQESVASPYSVPFIQHIDFQETLEYSQLYPASTLQLDEHPSPLFTFPSSHCSLPTTNPSPQIDLHCEVASTKMHLKPVYIWQVEEQPSPLFRLPSSHSYPVSRIVFPQTWIFVPFSPTRTRLFGRTSRKQRDLEEGNSVLHL